MRRLLIILVCTAIISSALLSAFLQREIIPLTENIDFINFISAC